MSILEENISQTYALSIGFGIKAFLNKLEDGEIAVPVYSVFDNVINFSSSEGIFSLVSSKVGMASSYIAVSEKHTGLFSTYDVKPGSKCFISRKCLNLADKLLIFLGNADTWENTIGKDFLWNRSQVSHENLFAFYSVVQRYSKEGSAFFRIQNKDRDFLDRIGFLANKEALKNPLINLKNLVGFGPGLTPTGDDLLLGFSLIVNSCREYSAVKDYFMTSLQSCLNLTTDFSGDILRKALRYEYHKILEDTLLAMIYKGPESVMLAAKDLLKIGATSGTDIASGIYLGIDNA